jgi:UDP-N-acetyl-2-amino-2-deoxyglucuronate dehydrogenase
MRLFSRPIPHTTSSNKANPDVFKVAIIGAGQMGIVSATAVHASGVAEVAYVMDRNEEAAKKIAQKYGAAYFSDLDVLLDRSDADIAFISVPHDHLVPLGIKATNAGKHVIIEKPIATRLEDACQLIKAAEQAKVYLTSNYWLRYLPSVQLAAQLIQQGALGDIVGLEIEVHQHKGTDYWSGAKGSLPDDWRALKARSGGGMLIMTACHQLEYVHHITQLNVARVYSEYDTLSSSTEVEDTLALVVKYTNGAIGTVSTSSNMRGSRIEQQRIWGKQGTLVFDREKLSFYSTRRIMGKRPGKWHSYKMPSFTPINGITELVQRFCNAILIQSPPEISSHDIWDNLAVILSAYDSLEQSAPILIPDLEIYCANQEHIL